MGLALGIVLGLVLAVLLLFLALPLRIEMQVVRDEALHVIGALRPFGRFGPRIPLTGRKPARHPRKITRSDKEKRRGNRGMNPTRIARAAIRLASDILRAVRLDGVIIDVRLGLGDPAETGQVYGQLTPLAYGMSGCRRCNVAIEPDFENAVLTGRAEVDLSVVPARLIWPVTRFGWTAFGPLR